LKEKLKNFLGLYGLPKRHGKLKELNKFDAQFFSVTPKQANYMDPQVRILLEVAFEAMLDAGMEIFYCLKFSKIFKKFKKFFKKIFKNF